MKYRIEINKKAQKFIKIPTAQPTGTAFERYISLT